MTIHRQRVNAGAFDKVEGDITDSVDTNGFSDAIQTVGAKTAKFSGGATMKANGGLIIGLTQVKINSGGATPGVRTEEVADFSGWTADGSTVDDSNVTFTSTSLITAPLDEAVVDYGSIATRTISLVTRLTGTRTEFGTGTAFLNYEISNDNITFTVPVTTPTQFQFIDLPATGGAAIPVDTGIVTFDDPNTQSFRYVKIIGGATGNNLQVGFIYQFTEEDIGANQVTVRLRSSATQDAADGTILITDQVMNPFETLAFITPLLLTGIGQFVTVEIVSLTSFDIPVTLSEITSVQEVT